MLFAPFLMIYLLIALAFLAILFLLIQIELISYAFRVLGLRPRAALFVLLVSLLGSYVNIPLYTVESGPRPLVATINYFGIVYAIPFEYAGPKTTVAVNIGGALVPLAVTAYALTRTPEAILPSVLGTAVVAFVTHQFARPIRGLGIALGLRSADNCCASCDYPGSKGAQATHRSRHRVYEWSSWYIDRRRSD